MRGGKWAIQPYFYEPDLLSSFAKGPHGFLGSLAARAHHHDHSFGIGGARIIKQAIAPSYHSVEHVHHVLNYLRRFEVERIDSLAVLKEHIRVLRGPANDGTIRC